MFAIAFYDDKNIKGTLFTISFAEFYLKVEIQTVEKY